MRQEDEINLYEAFGIDTDVEIFKSEKTVELDAKAESIVNLLKGENLEDIEYALRTVEKLCKKKATI